jgi:Holliday junction resolvase RusA-like endonuclease
VSWKAVLRGQPPTVNHLYDVAWKYDRTGRRYKGKVKNKAAQKYHDDAVLVLRSAKPSRWEAEGQVRIYYHLYLCRPIDADNILKVVNDAIATAVGINDSRFLPCVQSKVTGLPLREARIEVEIEALPLPSPDPAP